MPTTIDEQARRLVAALSQAADAELHVRRPDPQTVADLYLRVRDRLAQLGARAGRKEATDDLALTIYLTWLVEDDSLGPDVLGPLKACIAKALQSVAESDGPTSQS